MYHPTISPFRECTNVTSFTFGNEVEQIPNGLCSGLNKLTSITIPNSVTSIGDNAFYTCSDLTSVTIGNSVISLGNAAFRDCKNLTSITIPKNVTNIGALAFYDCKNLTSVYIPKSVTMIGEYAFSYTPWFENQQDGVVYINDVLYQYKGEMPTNASIMIEDGTISVTPLAFEKCSSLRSITIPSTMIKLGGGCFAHCDSLTSIICKPITPPSIITPIYSDYSTFAHYNSTIYVPYEAMVDYQTDTTWSKFKDIRSIESIGVTTDGVVITPSTNDVTIIWPTEGNADTYTIIIKKGNEVFCTLTFNANGQLLNIAFAPGRDGNHPTQYAEQAGNGYRFTVTGLEEGTHYAYNIDVRDTADKTIKSYTGEFTTESMTAVENITTNNANIQKITFV